MTREDAIKVAYGIPVTKAQHEALQFLIPELAESEDEKMRKELIFFLKEEIPQCSIKEHADKLKRFVSYLEKQKEQKSLNISAASEWLRKHISNYINSEYNEFHKCVEYDGSIDKERLINDFEEAMQKEQKSIEWEWPNLSNCIRNCKKCHGRCFYRKEPYEEQKPNFSEEDSTDFEIEVHEIIAQARNDSRLNDADVLKQFEEEAAFALMLKANKLIEQKPVKWSKEDDFKLGALITDIETRSDLTEAIKIKYVSFLMSLRQQPKQEWSEEDEAHRKFISESLEDQIRFCKKDAEGAYYAKQIRAAQNWLNDLPNKFNSEKNRE